MTEGWIPASDPLPSTPGSGNTINQAFPTATAVIPPAGPLSNGTESTPAGAAVDNTKPPVGAILGGILGGIAGFALLYIMFRVVHAKMKEEKAVKNLWDDANMLQNVKNEGVHVTTVAKQRYVYPGLIANSQLK